MLEHGKKHLDIPVTVSLGIRKRTYAVDWDEREQVKAYIEKRINHMIPSLLFGGKDSGYYFHIGDKGYGVKARDWQSGCMNMEAYEFAVYTFRDFGNAKEVLAWEQSQFDAGYEVHFFNRARFGLVDKGASSIRVLPWRKELNTIRTAKQLLEVAEAVKRGN